MKTTKVLGFLVLISLFMGFSGGSKASADVVAGLVLNGVSPSSGPISSTITLNGSGFSTMNINTMYGGGVWFTDGTYSANLYSSLKVINDNVATVVVPNSLCYGVEGNCNTEHYSIQPFGEYSIYIKSNIGNVGVQTTASVKFTVIASPTTSSHPVGSTVRGSDGTVYFISTGNTRSPYTSSGAFLSYKFNNWANLQTANSADMDLPLTSYFDGNHYYTYFIPPRNGSLINDHGTVYLITNGQRAGFTSANVFLEGGYSFGNVYAGDTSFMTTLSPIKSSAMAHSEGTLINDNGTMYVIKGGSRLGFPSMSVLESWGFWVQDAVPANGYDRNIPVGGVIQTRQADQINI